MQVFRSVSRRMWPILTGLAVIGVIVAVTVAVTLRSDVERSGASSRPDAALPILRLPAAAAEAGGDRQADAPVNLVHREAEYKILTPIPTGPASAPAYRLGPQRAGQAEVARPATALGLPGAPRRSGPGWVLESAAGRLVVSDGAGLRWSFGGAGLSCLPPLPTADPASIASCGMVAPARAEPATPATSRRAAEILQKLGASAASARRVGATYSVAGSVAGMSTVGWETTVTLHPTTGQLTSASGYLSRPTLLAQYPLISAAEAVRRLQRQPRMLSPVQRCMIRSGVPGCANPPAAAITGIRLGLQLISDRSSQRLLVPAWMFTGAPTGAPAGTVSIVAVADRYLDREEPSPPQPSAHPAPDGGGSGPGAGPDSRPGVSAPGSTGQPETGLGR